MKTVIEMAREAGLFTHKEVQPELERFAELVRADERARMAEQPAQQEPLFWYRPRSDGFYEGPIHNAQIEQIRKDSGGWQPLYTRPQAREPEQPTTPQGWKLVPVKPTPEQIKSGNKVTWPMPCKQVYTTMLAAAPQPAQPQQEPVMYDKTEMNLFAQNLYDQKMREGKRGHYESMFHVIHQCIKKVAPAQQEPGRNHWEDGDVFERIAASKKQPAQQEPVAYMGADIEGTPNKFRLNPFDGGIPLYKRPQSVKVWDAEGYGALCQELEGWKAKAQRTWVGLTIEDMATCIDEPSWDLVLRKADQILKEKNT